MLRLLQAAVFATAIVAGLPATADWPTESAALGARDHPKVLQRYGGEMPDENLTTYVRDVGLQMVSFSDRSDEDWTFTLLDSPKVNAFALPGGYVYVTRGLLALAQNEAQLAAVLAHEVTHVTEEHVEKRQDANTDALIDGALGALMGGIFGGATLDEAIRDGVETVFGEIGQYSREQEYAADEGGIALLIAAGYDPAAQADFLMAMAANAELAARVAGRDYDPGNVPFFANHPAPAERLSRAQGIAGNIGGFQGTETYLAMIDGINFGDSSRQGFMRGRRFIHPVFGFTFDVPQGLRVENASQRVNIIGPNNATLVLSGNRYTGGPLTGYVRDWATQIPQRELIGRRITDQHNFETNGLPAATGSVRIRRNARRGVLQLTVIEMNGHLYRFAGFSRDRDRQTKALLWQVVESFRPMTVEEIAEFRDAVIVIHQVERGETVASLSANFPEPGFAAERFRMLNGLVDGEEPETGSLVKLIAIDR